MQDKNPQDWHSLEAARVAKTLETDTKHGLSSKEAEARLAKYGPNEISKKKRQSAIVLFLLQFHQPLIYILLAATVVTIFLSEYIDASVIFAVVLVNAIIGFIQESKALKAIDALASSMTSGAVVLRDGRKKNIDARELVPGDVVIFQSGDKIPADVRLFYQRDLKIDESALTGESVAVEKNDKPVETESMIGDRHSMGFASTNVTYGSGRGIVVATGDKTEVGKIQESISAADNLETPLTLKIKSFSSLLLWVILALSAAVFAVGVFRGADLADSFMIAVALAVGTIPEGLPVAVTIMLALGVSKMARNKAIIRKLVAVETLGSTNVICSDKTGTLTENQMTVQRIYSGGRTYSVTGLGYRPEGEILENDKPADITASKALELCLKAGILCNDSQVKEKDGHWIIEGDPTEGSLLVAAKKAGFSEEKTEQDYPRTDAIPFESEYQYMATLHQNGNAPVIFLKGSVEAVLDRCTQMLDDAGNPVPVDTDQIHRKVDQMAANGLRVLAFATATPPAGKSDITHNDTRSDMVFLGLQGMIDPPRKEVIEAVRLCQKAGIDVKMITGDHAVTASAIAGEIGLKGRLENDRLVAITGKELQQISDQDLPQVATDTSVFARVAPEQKLRLVKALQAQGKIVAMTGDGVNDGPALKQANIGVAMGITGTDVAKDAADMILTDDNFSSIEGAVEEGRGVYDNLTKFIVWTLPTNLGESLVVILAVILNTPLPVLPVQFLWINMTTATFLGLTLAFEPKEPGIMDQPPRPASNPILTFELIMRTLLVGFVMMVASFGLYFYEVNVLGATPSEGQTVTTTTFVILESFYLLNCRSLIRPLAQVSLWSNRLIYIGIGSMLAVQLLFVYAPFMNVLFNSSPIGLGSWLRMLAAGAVLFIIITIEKSIRYRVAVKKGEIVEE